MFVSVQDMEELTGRKLAAAQRRWLDTNGIKYLKSANGDPKVLLAELERHMLSGAKKKGAGPQLGAIP